MTVPEADLLDARVPRYTSYPTAPHFTGEIDAASYGAWLEDVSVGEKVSLYFHVPFCASMCSFCGCYTKIVKRYEPVADYLALLEREAEMVAAVLGPEHPVTCLHWGGGSPTILKGEDWLRFADRLRQLFTVSDHAEWAVEMDPRTTTRAYVDALARAGVTRISLGVQDFNPEVQKAVNRVQPFDLVDRVVSWLRDAGIEAINMDLMYGLPHQTEASVVRTAELALTLRPSRLALFGYAHVPWMKSHQKLIDEAGLPGIEMRWRQYQTVSDALTGHGYRAIGLDHFARAEDEMARAADAGTLHRNFQGYTTDTAGCLIGLGASAIGRLPQGYVQNHQPLHAYREAIAAGRFATARGRALTGEDRLRGGIIETLMCGGAVDLDRSGPGFSREMSDLEALAGRGLVALEGQRIRVTDKGRPFVRIIAAVFDAYLPAGTARHSVAV